MLNITQPAPAISYVQFTNLPITISAGRTGDTIESITITKAPSSLVGTATTYAYDNLWLTFGSGTSQNFITTNTLSTTGVGTSQFNLYLSGKYTDYMFPRTIKYYDNPQNVPITIDTTITTSYPTINNNLDLTIPANPRTLSVLTKQTVTNTTSTTENRAQFYYTASSWATVPSQISAIYYFQPYGGGPNSNYFSYNITVTYTNTDPFFGFEFAGETLTDTFTVYHTVNYNLDYDRDVFLGRLNNQRLQGDGVRF